MAALNMFLKVDGVTGESQAANHVGEIDVLAWSWGQSQGARTARGAQPSLCIQDLSLTKYIDAATPELIMKSVIGEVTPNAELSVHRTGAPPSEYITLKMRNVTVTSISTGGSGGEDRLTENITLRFETMQGSYVKQGNPTPITFDIPRGANNCR
jgi:type VI secretion system secreted protein Hcp